MIDIVERLRTRPTGDPHLHAMVYEAADEIERLREALQWMIDHDESGPNDLYHLAGLERAKAALDRTHNEG